MNLSVHDEKLSQHIVYVLLLKSAKNSFLPELLDVVGEDKMMEMLQLFAGMKFQFPTIKDLERHAKDVNIFFRLHRTPAKRRPAVMKDLAHEYFVEEDDIQYLFKKMQKLVLQELHIKL